MKDIVMTGDKNFPLMMLLSIGLRVLNLVVDRHSRAIIIFLFIPIVMIKLNLTEPTIMSMIIFFTLLIINRLHPLNQILPHQYNRLLALCLDSVYTV